MEENKEKLNKNFEKSSRKIWKTFWNRSISETFIWDEYEYDEKFQDNTVKIT